MTEKQAREVCVFRGDMLIDTLGPIFMVNIEKVKAFYGPDVEIIRLDRLRINNDSRLPIAWERIVREGREDRDVSAQETIDMG